MTVLAVHGIGNHQGRARSQAAERLADGWRPSLAAGYRDTGLTFPYRICG